MQSKKEKRNYVFGKLLILMCVGLATLSTLSGAFSLTQSHFSAQSMQYTISGSQMMYQASPLAMVAPTQKVTHGASPQVTAPKYNQVFGLATAPNISAMNTSLKGGIKNYRDDLDLVPSDIALVKAEHLTYNTQILAILGPSLMGAVASSNSPLCSINCNWTLAQWNTSVANVITKYPFVNSFEIWNEPYTSSHWSGYFNGSAKNYFELIKSAATLVHASNPNAIVVCFGGASIANASQLTWYTQVWNMGASKYCNAISIHGYLASNTLFYSSNGVATSAVTTWKNSFVQYENLTGGLPIWITETGRQSSQNNSVGTYSNANQQVFLNQTFGFLANLSYIQRVYWYNLYGLSSFSTARDFGLLTYGTMSKKPAWNSFLNFYNAGNTVQNIPPPPTTVSLVAAKGSAIYGTNDNITATSSKSTDTVQIMQGSNVLAKGTGKVILNAKTLAVGTYKITANDITAKIGTKSNTITISQATPAITLTVPVNFAYNGTGPSIKYGVTSISNQITATLNINGVKTTSTTKSSTKFTGNAVIGTYTIYVSVKGNANYISTNSAVTTLKITLPTADPILSIASGNVLKNTADLITANTQISIDGIQILVNGSVKASGTGSTSYTFSSNTTGTFNITARDTVTKLQTTKQIIVSKAASGSNSMTGINITFLATNLQQVDDLVSMFNPYIRSGDSFDIVSGSSNVIANVTTINRLAATLHSTYPTANIYARTSGGISNLQVLASGVNKTLIKGIGYYYASGAEPEFTWNFTSSWMEFKQVQSIASAAGLQGIGIAAGKPLANISQFGWNYANLKTKVNGLVVETQPYCSSTAQFQNATQLVINEFNSQKILNQPSWHITIGSGGSAVGSSQARNCTKVLANEGMDKEYLSWSQGSNAVVVSYLKLIGR